MGLITNEVEIKLSRSSYKYYESLGYEIPTKKAADSTRIHNCKKIVYDFSKPILVKAEDLSPHSNVRVKVKCDICGIEKEIRYASYFKSISHQGYYTCFHCNTYKTQKTNQERYGVNLPAQNKEILQKMMDTCIEKYGVHTPIIVPEFKEKADQTCLKKYSAKLNELSALDDFKKRREETNLQRYGYKNAIDNPKIKRKAMLTLSKNSNIATSRQQIYIHNLYGEELNYVIHIYPCDIVFTDINLVCEYNGGGHNLCVQLNKKTQEEFETKEIIKNSYLKNHGYKLMIIKSNKDYIPSDDVLIYMLEYTKKYFNDNPQRSWITWDIDNNCICNANHKDPSDGIFFNFGKLRKIYEKDISRKEELIYDCC